MGVVVLDAVRRTTEPVIRLMLKHYPLLGQSLGHITFYFAPSSLENFASTLEATFES